ncbi:hypothetical protein CEUSTIGMA_g13649.t1 [Chlamydomonas eustigma]|uniref:Uncharacterized protein n=1 Tax=Chlamydomonas eustigma TaxID=1157962 RepID=A0A250XT69_9CHLO|nr:hypothetical protein CEUSTIGMA_g13649.t1 [Chlamydomonas eustigma]|eukprot:GAX86236.1 hypothetical protein CEUSTIGMA_g13649.t1 [Chlamydomonas eustigma]
MFSTRESWTLIHFELPHSIMQPPDDMAGLTDAADLGVDDVTMCDVPEEVPDLEGDPNHQVSDTEGFHDVIDTRDGTSSEEVEPILQGEGLPEHEVSAGLQSEDDDGESSTTDSRDDDEEDVANIRGHIILFTFYNARGSLPELE